MTYWADLCTVLWAQMLQGGLSLSLLTFPTMGPSTDQAHIMQALAPHLGWASSPFEAEVEKTEIRRDKGVLSIFLRAPAPAVRRPVLLGP